VRPAQPVPMMTTFSTGEDMGEVVFQYGVSNRAKRKSTAGGR
jgi:hypothetical protein